MAGFDGKDPERDEDRDFEEIASASYETLRETAVRRYGDQIGLAVLGYVCSRYLADKQTYASFAYEMYEEGAPRLMTDLSLDDVEVLLVQAGLQVLTIVGDDLDEFQHLIKNLLMKINDEVKIANAKTTPEEQAKITEVAQRLEWRRVEEHLRSVGKQLGLPDEAIEETIANAKREAEAELERAADDEVGFKSGPLQ